MSQDDFLKKQAIEAGAGKFGRVLMMSDPATLPQPLLMTAVRDIAANMISVGQALHRLRSCIPEPVATLPEVQDLDRAIGDFERHRVEVDRGILEAFNDPDEQVRIELARAARAWVLSGLAARDRCGVIVDRLMGMALQQKPAEGYLH